MSALLLVEQLGPNKRWRVEEVDEVITFTWADTEGVHYLHNDPMVISLYIANYDINRIVVNNGSFMDALFL